MRWLLFVILMSWTAVALADDRVDDMDAGAILLKETFDQDTQTGLAQRLLDHRHITLAKGAGPDGSDAIRVAYVGYQRGSQRVVAPFPLDSTVEAATLSFDVRFEQDFQWVRGGKLHGLGPQHPVTGGRKRRPDGWSARLMWGRDGRCSTYLYDQNARRKWAAGRGSGKTVFSAGQWHNVLLQVSLNTPGQENGFARVFVDGQEVINHENVAFRGTDGDDARIQQFLFSTFHGGSSPQHAPVDAAGNFTTVYAFFDNIVITEGIQTPEADDLKAASEAPEP